MESRLVGQVSLDSGEVAILDAMYIMGDADHDAGRTPAEVAPSYDGVVTDAHGDGTCDVFVDSEDGRPTRIRIEFRRADS